MEILNDPTSDDGHGYDRTRAEGKGYVSSEISTHFDPAGAGNSLEYGEISARIRLPGGSNSNAIWPAFWMSAMTFRPLAGPPAAKSTSWRRSAHPERTIPRYTPSFRRR